MGCGCRSSLCGHCRHCGVWVPLFALWALWMWRRILDSSLVLWTLHLCRNPSGNCKKSRLEQMNLSKQAVSKQNVTCCQTRALLPPPSSQATVINWSPAGSLTQVSLSLLQTVCFISVVTAKSPAPSFANCEHVSLLSVAVRDTL